MFSFRRAGALIAATTSTALVVTAVPAFAADDEKVQISIANFTDFHGRLEANLSTDKETGEVTPKKGDEMGAANIAGIINFLRDKNANTIVTSSGDNQGGSAFVSAISDDKYTMDFVKAVGTVGSAAGNHEFDKGYKDLIDRINPGTGDIQLGANVFKEDGSRDLEASKIVEIDGVKVALVGTTSNLTKSKSSPDNVAGLNFTDSSKQVNKEAKKLKDEKKADVVVALIHDPVETGAPKLDPEYVDFMFGGDSHVNVVNADAPVPNAQSWEYGKVVTDLDFTYNKTTGEIEAPAFEQYDAESLVTLDITPDAEVQKIVDEAKAEAGKLGEEVVANVQDTYLRGSNPGENTGSNRGTESTANNMLAESALYAMDKSLEEHIDLGIMNAGGVRADLEAGDVTYQEAFQVQPFGNDISVATLSGKAIKDALERQWQSKEDAEKSGRPRLDMGLSNNVAYTYNPEAEAGERITSVTINGQPLEDDKDYRIAGSSFLFAGGDNFVNPDDVRDLLNVGYNDLQAFVDYLKSDEVGVRKGQKDVGVVLPEELKAGTTASIKLSSLNYSSEGEPMAKQATVTLGDATATADIDASTTKADNGLGEQGRATVDIAIPAEAAGEQTLTITTDAGTELTVPVTVAAADPKPSEEPAPSEKPAPSEEPKPSEEPTPGDEQGAQDGSTANLGTIMGAVAGVLALLGLLAVVFAGPIDQVLGPIAKLS